MAAGVGAGLAGAATGAGFAGAVPAVAAAAHCGSIAVPAAVQLDTCSPDFLVQAFNTNDLHLDIFATPTTIEDGFITPPTGPGLGVEPDQTVVNRQLAN